MKRLQATGLFVGVSPFSFVFAIVGALLLILMANMSFISDSGLLKNTIFGSDSQLGLIETSTTSWQAIRDSVLGNPWLNKFLFFGFWMMVGLVVYVVLVSFGESVAQTADELESIKYVHARKKTIEQHLLLRLAVRGAVLLGLGFWSWIFGSLIFPFSVLAGRIWLYDLRTPINWLYGLLGISVLVLSLHLLVVLFRLLVLRPRVFGGWDRFVD